MTSPALSLSSSVASAITTGFKDWALICAALGHGRQSIILRKGGIAEGREGFRFKHEEFFLFPTQFHQQLKMVRLEELAGLALEPDPPSGMVEIRYSFKLEFAVWVDQWATVERLKPLHVWRDEVARARFDYEGQAGLQCAFGRVFRLERPWLLADRPSFGGCRSWINLPSHPDDIGFVPVISDELHAERANAVRSVLNFS